MNPMNLTLRCYVEREVDGSWFAMCIDLNLCAQATTVDEAKRKLHAQVEQYVREALTVDREHAHRLLNRRAPLSFIVRYHFIASLCALIRAIKPRRHRSDKRIFNELLPVVPA
jgi:hypothetical protein